MFGKKKDKIIIEDIEKSEDDEYNELCGKNRKNIIKICKIKQNNDLKYLTYFFKFFFDEKFHDELYTYCKLYTECFNEFITSFKKIQNFFNKNSKFNFEIKNNTTIINLFGCVNTLYKNSYYKIKPKNIILVCKEILNPERNLLGSKREKFNSDFFKKAIHEDLKEYINFLSLQKTPYSTKKLETDTDYYLKSSVFDGDEKDRYAIEMITEDMKNLFKAFINISVLEKKKTYLEEIDSIQEEIFVQEDDSLEKIISSMKKGNTIKKEEIKEEIKEKLKETRKINFERKDKLSDSKSSSTTGSDSKSSYTARSDSKSSSTTGSDSKSSSTTRSITSQFL